MIYNYLKTNDLGILLVKIRLLTKKVVSLYSKGVGYISNPIFN